MIRDPERWLDAAARKTGIDRDLLAKAFAAEIAEPREPDAPLEVPDRMAIDYRYSHGGVSRFFRELRDHDRLLGSRCPTCEKIWMPPRARCQVCFSPTAWVPVGPGGRITTFTTVHFATSAFFEKVPFVCAYILLDGADTPLMQNVVLDDVAAARVGLRVTARFREVRLGDMGDFFFALAEA